MRTITITMIKDHFSFPTFNKKNNTNYHLAMPPSSSSSTSSNRTCHTSPQAAVVATMALATSSLVTAATCYFFHQRRLEQESRQWEQKRQEERTGRIRAEKKLRYALLKESQNNNNSTGDTTTTTNEKHHDPHAMNLSTIGTIVSPYTKRMGTPRQGALVPSSRGFVQFENTLSPEAVDGIQDYSHVWIIFGFHANTSLATSKKTKVRPPRGGGIKVGQLATRSPHRPNALGLSLVALDKWEPSSRRLYISALDLVNGTPVYDIKPYVHWDMPGGGDDLDKLKVPSWVENRNDVLPKVEFDAAAEEALKMHVEHNRLAPLYPKSSKSKSEVSSSLEAAKQTLTEILAQDPRSSHKGVSKNRRGSLSQDESYKLIFARVEVEFVVKESGAYVIAIHRAPEETEEEKESIVAESA
jgi:tRNA-Thr(GGU) m(6)t(6)A37 methyltransferase TsaA